MALQNEVQEGPDLNVSRNPFDKKEYRNVLLPNGLRALLVSDTVAMAENSKQTSDSDDDDNSEKMSTGTEEEDEGDDDEDEQDDEDASDEEESEAGGGIRSAAAAMIVGVGSMYDPPEVQGLSHFLEHLLFMGSKYVCSRWVCSFENRNLTLALFLLQIHRKYPSENAYDKFISKHGGSDNAYTESEHTVYYFDIPQEHLEGALDIFAQFFIEPLMMESSVERELNSIESEFQLVKVGHGCSTFGAFSSNTLGSGFRL